MCPKKGPECFWAEGGVRRPDGGGAALGAGVSHASSRAVPRGRHWLPSSYSESHPVRLPGVVLALMSPGVILVPVPGPGSMRMEVSTPPGPVSVVRDVVALRRQRPVVPWGRWVAPRLLWRLVGHVPRTRAPAVRCRAAPTLPGSLCRDRSVFCGKSSQEKQGPTLQVTLHKSPLSPGVGPGPSGSQLSLPWGLLNLEPPHPGLCNGVSWSMAELAQFCTDGGVLPPGALG